MICNKVEYFRSYDERRKREVELEASGTRYTEDERVEEFDDFSVTYYILVVGDQYEK